MGYPLRMPLVLLQRLLQVEEAMRCVTPGLKKETRHVIVTVKGILPPHLDLGNWGVLYLRSYTPEPLRCFRCQQFGHQQNNCFAPRRAEFTVETLNSTVPRQIQGEGRGDTQVSQL